MQTKLPPPSEGMEQATLMNWAAMKEWKWPELRLLFHVPNEGKRSKSTGGRMVKEGLKKGVPDIMLPVPRNGYAGMFIEMKRQREARVSEEQKQWLADLAEQGYAVAICYGWEAASECLTAYMDNRGFENRKTWKTAVTI